MVFKYDWRVRGLNKAPAQVAGEVCASLENSPKGLSPKTLLDASRAADAPLHDEFEWRDDVAAELYREDQAGNLIRNLRIVVVEEEEEPTARAFVNVHTATKPGSYHCIQTVLGDDAMKAKLLDSAKREMRSFVDKYNTLEELSTIITEIRNYI